MRDDRPRQFPLRDLRAQRLGRDVGALLDDVRLAIESLGQELDVLGCLRIAAADEARSNGGLFLYAIRRSGACGRPIETDTSGANGVLRTVRPARRVTRTVTMSAPRRRDPARYLQPASRSAMGPRWHAELRKQRRSSLRHFRKRVVFLVQ